MVATLLTGCSVVGGFIGQTVNQVTGSHRVEVASPPEPTGPDGPLNTGKADHHWVALSKAWAVAQTDDEPHHYGLGTDGSRVFALRAAMAGTYSEPIGEAELTAYDAGSGNQLWRTNLQWIKGTDPISAEGTVVIATGLGDRGSGLQPAEYVGLDAATGTERWRVKVEHPTPELATGRDNENAMYPGVFLDKVFYYADGTTWIGVDAVTGKQVHRSEDKNFRSVAGPIAVADQLGFLAEPTPDNEVPEQQHHRILVILNKDLSFAKEATFPKFLDPDRLAAAGDVLVSWGDGRMWAIDRRTTNELWNTEYPDRTQPTAPVDGVIPRFGFQTSQDSATGIDVATGKEVWTLPPKPEGTMGERHLAGVDGTLFALGHDIEIVDPGSGKVSFVYETNRGGGQAVAAGGNIVVYNQDGITGLK
jgi:outer membrane protein assembly factor BamB